MKTKEEEYVDEMINKFPYIRQYFPDEQGYIFLCRTLADYGKLMYNQAIEDCIKNSNIIYTEYKDSTLAEVNTDFFLKLKK